MVFSVDTQQLKNRYYIFSITEPCAFLLEAAVFNPIMEPRLINSITHMTNSRSLNGSPLHKNGKNGNNHHVRFTPDAEKKSAEMAHSGSFLEKHVFEELTIRYYFIS